MPSDPPTPDPEIDSCPSWCASDHSAATHPDDRYHDTLATYVPVLLDRGSTPGRLPPEPTEFVIITSRKHGQREDWTFIGEDDRPGQHLRISPESAHRLNVALAGHLATINGNYA